MTIYCVCGFKNEYSGSRPKFCGGCGNPFDAAFKHPTSTATVAVMPPTSNPAHQAPTYYAPPSPPPGYYSQQHPAYQQSQTFPVQYQQNPQHAPNSHGVYGQPPYYPAIPELPEDSVNVQSFEPETLTLGQLQANKDSIHFERPRQVRGQKIDDEHIPSMTESMSQRLQSMRESAGHIERPQPSRMNNNRRSRKRS